MSEGTREEELNYPAAGPPSTQGTVCIIFFMTTVTPGDNQHERSFQKNFLIRKYFSTQKSTGNERNPFAAPSIAVRHA